MKEIALTQGYFTIVDDEDYEQLSRHKWCATRQGNIVYASRHRMKEDNGKKTTIQMHRQIMEYKQGYIIDHINGDGLDNCRKNLRHVTTRQNAQNRHTEKSSRFPGVFRDSYAKKWRALIKVNGKKIYLGSYTEEEEAFNAYCDASFKFTGQKVLEQIS